MNIQKISSTCYILQCNTCNYIFETLFDINILPHNIWYHCCACNDIYYSNCYHCCRCETSYNITHCYECTYTFKYCKCKIPKIYSENFNYNYV